MSNMIVKHGAPTINTAGSIGQRYFDIDSGRIYECKSSGAKIVVDGSLSHPHNFVAVNSAEAYVNEYVWEEVGAGSGGGGTNSLCHIAFEHIYSMRNGENKITVLQGDYETIKARLDSELPVFAVYIYGCYDPNRNEHNAAIRYFNIIKIVNDVIEFWIGKYGDHIFLYPDNTAVFGEAVA